MKCLDCGYDIAPDELGEHEGHQVVKGSFSEEQPPEEKEKTSE